MKFLEIHLIQMLMQAYDNKFYGGIYVYVKIPVVNSRGLFCGKVIKGLSRKGFSNLI